MKDAPAHPIVPAFERFYSDPNADAVAGGRILLGELNCTSCHKGDRLPQGSVTPKRAPTLTGVASRVKPAALRAQIAEPHRTKPGSTMPDLFAGKSADERNRQVDALVHFLMSTGGGVIEQNRDRGAVARGETLFHQVGCVACHGPRKAGAKPLATNVPLGDVEAKYSIYSLAQFLRDPLAVRPSGRMPSLMLTDVEAKEIASYFLKDIEVTPNLAYRYYEGDWDELPDFDKLKPKDSGEVAGFDIGVAKREGNMGLVFEGFLHVDREANYQFFLHSDDGSRLLIDGQLVVNNDGAHPPQTKDGKIKLDKGPHAIRVDYFNAGGGAELSLDFQTKKDTPRHSASSVVSLVKDRQQHAADAFEVNPALAEEGQRLFTSVGCASCHEMKIDNKTVATSLSAKPLASVSVDRGCLAASVPAGLPQFKLNDRQRQTMAMAIKAATNPSAQPPDLNDVVKHTLATFNCYACHERDKIGGVEDSRNDFFYTTVKEMGDEGRIPPHLNGVGGKLTTHYLKTLFNKGAKDRPYMLTRMPRFGEGNVGALVPAFESLDNKDEPLKPVEFDLPLARVKAEGRHLVGNKAFSCIKCHNFKNLVAEGIPGIDLTTMTERLRPEWFYRYVRNPQVFRPGTRMPSAWPKLGKSVLATVLDGDSEKQVHAVWLYLTDGPKAQVPLGATPQQIELVASTEPIIYRNFIDGAGPRAIGVGYPEKVNLAFDSTNLRLAMVWHGAFIDASMHWSGRSSGFQPPLGDNVLKLVDGPALAVLESQSSPWPKQTARELGQHFRGYRLDKDRRPTLLYECQSLAIEDFCRPAANKPGASLLRTLSIAGSKPVENLWYRAAVAGKIEPLSEGWYQIDGWKMRLVTSAKPIIRTSDGRNELLLPITPAGGKMTIDQEFVW